MEPEPDNDNGTGEQEKESLFHDLELRYISLRNEYESVCSERNNLEGMSIISWYICKYGLRKLCGLHTFLAAKNKVLDETIDELRGISQTSSSEASRHSMELKQVRVKLGKGKFDVCFCLQLVGPWKRVLLCGFDCAQGIFSLTALFLHMH